MTGLSGRTGLTRDDLNREATRFGVGELQVRRDHAISHILAALSRHLADDIVFFGGTALSRTHLADARLSEDVDLIALGQREVVAAEVAKSIEAALLRSHGRVTWQSVFGANDVDPAVLAIPDGIAVRVQVLDRRQYEQWPVERRDIEQRYSDAAPARLLVPTVESFSGSKTAAWFDRHAARDLYDLWAMAERGCLTREAAIEFTRYGPTGGPPRAFMFDKAPTQQQWVAQLAGQTRLRVTAAQAIDVVRHAWANAVGDAWS
jgi:predicted nucleotidyltransferase component of viral defense system